MSSPLLLENYFIEKFHVEANRNYRSGEKVQNALGVGVEEARRRRGKDGAQPLSVRLTVTVNEKPSDFKKSQYRVSLVVIGRFRTVAGVPQKVVETLIALNAPAILYGIARGHVAQATAVCPWGRMLLPTVNFLTLRQQKSTSNATLRSSGRSLRSTRKPRAPKKVKRRAKKART